MWDFLWSRGGTIPTLSKESWTRGWCGWENYVCCSEFLLVSSSWYIPEGWLNICKITEQRKTTGSIFVLYSLSDSPGMSGLNPWWFHGWWNVALTVWGVSLQSKHDRWGQLQSLRTVSPQEARQVEWKLSDAALLMSMKEKIGEGREERKEEEEEERKYRHNRKCYTRSNISTCRKI